MIPGYIIRGIMALGYLMVAIYCLRDPKRRLPYAYASAILPFGLALAQLCGTAKDAMAVIDGLALIVLGVACGLILSEPIRQHLAQKRSEDGAERPLLQ